MPSESGRARHVGPGGAPDRRDAQRVAIHVNLTIKTCELNLPVNLRKGFRRDGVWQITLEVESAAAAEQDEVEAAKINPADLRIDTYRASSAGESSVLPASLITASNCCAMAVICSAVRA